MGVDFHDQRLLVAKEQVYIAEVQCSFFEGRAKCAESIIKGLLDTGREAANNYELNGVDDYFYYENLAKQFVTEMENFYDPRK